MLMHRLARKGFFYFVYGSFQAWFFGAMFVWDLVGSEMLVVMRRYLVRVET